jgi:hypothetical protein
MDHLQASPANLYLHAIDQWKVSLQTKSLRISGVHADRDTLGLSHDFQGSHVIGMAVGQQYAVHWRSSHRLQDAIGIFAWIDNG